MVSIQMAKYNNRIEDIYKMCYEVRDGVNSQCNFMDAPFTSADTMVEGAAVSKAVQGSCETYEARMRMFVRGQSSAAHAAYLKKEEKG